MANLTKYLASISPDSRSGPSLGRRLLALSLCAMLVLGSTLPSISLARENDSEGEGVTAELPELPDLDPGGEETDLTEEVPASGGGEEEGEAVEVEPEVDTEAPPPEEVTSTATEVPAEAPPPQPVVAPEPMSPAPEPDPEPESVQRQAPEPAVSEPVVNQSIVAPRQRPVERHPADGATSSQVPLPAEPVEPERASPPQPVAASQADTSRNLPGKGTYVVRPGDCLWHIAAGLLPDDASTHAVAREVERLWRLNEDRIGTGDPSLIYAGTELTLT